MTNTPPSTSLVVPRGTPLTPGKLYLRLFHGRTDPAQDMNDWGFDGPIFGPLCSVHQTYGGALHFYGEDAADECRLSQHEDMIVWDGGYYGDVAIFVAGGRDKA